MIFSVKANAVIDICFRSVCQMVFQPATERLTTSIGPASQAYEDESVPARLGSQSSFALQQAAQTNLMGHNKSRGHRSMTHFCSGPIEWGPRGRIGRSKVPRYVRRCTFEPPVLWAISAILHFAQDSLFSNCPHVTDLWQQYAQLFQGSHDAMRCFMRQKDQKSIWASVSAIVKQAQTARQI